LFEDDEMKCGRANSQKKINRNSRNTIDIPTGSDFAPLAREGVSVSTAETIIMQRPMPIPPTIRRNFRPNRSTIHTAFRVKIIPNVAFNAFMRAIWLLLVNTFW
jgi:hypothetical protein